LQHASLEIDLNKYIFKALTIRVPSLSLAACIKVLPVFHPLFELEPCDLVKLRVLSDNANDDDDVCSLMASTLLTAR